MANQSYIRSTRLSDILDLSRIARGVNMEITQLDAGSFESEVVQLKVHNVLASRISSNRRLRLQGNVSFLTISFVSGGSGASKWHGIDVKSNDLLMANAGEEFDLVVTPGIEAYCVSTVGDAEMTLRNLGGPVLAEKLSATSCPIPCDPETIQAMEDWFMKKYQGFDGDSSLSGESASDLKNAFLRRLATCLRTGTPTFNSEDLAFNNKAEVIWRVEQHILDDLAIPQTVDDLCHVVGTSRRTLEYAFDGYFGTSPKKFIKSLRLNAARNDLLLGEYGSLTVAEVATGLGFSHMGQFSSDYRRMFGENPSKTLRHSPLVTTGT